MDIVVGAGKAIWEFWTWIAGDFWPALVILILGYLLTVWRAKLDAGEVANRMQRKEYTGWKRGYLSGQLTGSTPSASQADANLRWFVVRKEKKPEKVIISNRGESSAYHVRVRLTDSNRKAAWRWKIRAGKSMRFRIGKISDKNWNGVDLDIHWDDKKLLAQKVTFLVPQSEFDFPRPVVTFEEDKSTPPESASLENPAAVTPRANPLRPEAPNPARPTTTPTALTTPRLPSPISSPRTPLPRNGTHSSTNIADKSIPNRTPGIPADFEIISDDGQLFLFNAGLGDASHVYLQPLDEDKFAVGGGGFWRSIPAKTSKQLDIADPRDIGSHNIFFKVSWDDGFQLKRRAKLKIQGKSRSSEF